MKHSNLAITITLITGSILASQVVYANPNGAQVVQGTASFSSPSASVLNVNNSRNAIINWQSFNIDAGQTTNFIQPSSSSSVLNRVISSDPSQILGNLNSNGRVFLINQHGILVGEGANINTAGFFGSTLNITDSDFLNGNLKFDGGGQGNFENQGYIHAGEDGSIVLIAPNIENGGVIEVDNGNIILAAGKSITITSLENSSIQFEVTSAENQITNLGQIVAKNGAAGLFAGTLKHSGSIRASGLVQNADGSISLVATDHVEVTGSIDVSGDQGGYIEILGDVVDINDGASINASGTHGGGEILIGGDQQGLNPEIKNATSTTISKNAEVHADATDSGDGGKVIVFAKNDVHVHGVITAKGGAQSGDGGFIETSGLKQLDITSVPDASAENGKAGEWLIDPNNIDIVAGAVNPDFSPIFTSFADSTQLGVDLIIASLDAGTSVIISTGAGGTEQGDINVNANIDINASIPGDLTLSAHNDININADIKQTSFGFSNLTLTSDSDASGSGQINFANSTIDMGGTVTLNGSSSVNGLLSLATFSFDSWVLNNPMTISASGGISIPNGSGVNFSGSNIINNGTIQLDSGCDLGFDCGAPYFASSITNNGLFEITSGHVGIDADFDNFGTIDILTGNPEPLFTTGFILGQNATPVLRLYAGSIISGVADSSLIINSGSTVATQGSASLINTTVIHDGQIAVTNSADRLTLTNTQLITGSTGTITGLGILDLQTGSNWTITTAGQLLPAAMTLDLNGGNITNIENFIFPGTVNVYQASFVEGGSIIIPDTTTFNYFANNDILPNFGVTNNGAFIIQNNMATMNLSVLNGAAFVNNGTFQINSATTLNLLSDFQNNGLLSLSTGSTVVAQAGATLFQAGAISGFGSLSINGGVMDIATPTILPDTLALNLVSGSLTGAQNLSIPGVFNWLGGTLGGVGSGFTTAGQVTVTELDTGQGGILDADWTIAPTGVVDWSSTSLTSLTNANLVNQGALLIDAGVGTTVFDFNFDNDNGLLGLVSGKFRIEDALGGAQDFVLDQSGDRLQGFGTFDGNVLNQFGRVSPGRSDVLSIIDITGTLTINGDYTQGPDGILDIKLDSTFDGLQHDVLKVAGLLTAGGAIKFWIVNNKSVLEIAALLDQSFSPLVFGSFAGKFAEVNIPTGLEFTLGDNGLITISSGNLLLNKAANLLEALVSRDDLNFSELVEVMQFIDLRARIALYEEEDERRAPRLVCK